MKICIMVYYTLAGIESERVVFFFLKKIRRAFEFDPFRFGLVTKGYISLIIVFIVHHHHWRSSHYAVTHVRNENSNIQGRSPYVVSDFPCHKELLL